MPFLKDKRKLHTNLAKLDNLTKKNGLRHAVFKPTGDKYIGEWKNNLPDGNGLFLSRTFKMYEGQWEKDFRHGFGVYSIRQENKVFLLQYRGDWRKGMFSGFGARHYLDGSFYLGYWKNSKRHGYGQMWYADGGYYDGDWKRDLRHGLGMWVRPDGNRYEGSWAFDVKHGKGRFFHLDSGQMQEGVWQNDYCVYSFVIDIIWRQACVDPTPYPIRVNELVNLEGLCEDRERKMLLEQYKSCISFSTQSSKEDTRTL